jgi:hypothetical protein
MCQHMIFLAERAGQRYISQCEHGTVHFVWEGVGLHLPAAAFLQLAQRLLPSEATFHTEINQTKQEHFYLQVGRMMVALPLDAYLPVIHMIEEALPQINQQNQTDHARPPQLTFPQQCRSVVLN